jgi:hypothetical protein
MQRRMVNGWSTRQGNPGFNGGNQARCRLHPNKPSLHRAWSRNLCWKSSNGLTKSHLHAVDTDDERKANLRTIIKRAVEFEKVLSVQLPSDSQKLPSQTGWVLAFTRYRLGRALAYRELPVVKRRWPISEPDEYQQQLTAVFKRLTDQSVQTRPEFILLHDRMLRRSGNKGQALELLELHKRSIKPKWYLKKRRDLLQELGWGPPHQEAARLYLEAGYADEPNPDSVPALTP